MSTFVSYENNNQYSRLKYDSMHYSSSLMTKKLHCAVIPCILLFLNSDPNTVGALQQENVGHPTDDSYTIGHIK